MRKNKKKLGIMVAAVCLVGSIGVGASFAYFTDQAQKVNTVTMGKVDIDLNEPEFDKNPDSTISNIVPGQKIVKDPMITVADNSQNVYVRAKLTQTGLSDIQFQELLPNINIDMTQWFLGEDGYYYFQEQKKAGEKIPFFTGLIIPKSWGNEAANLTFHLNVVAEAVQADNFTAITAGEPITSWGDITVESRKIAVETLEKN